MSKRISGVALLLETVFGLGLFSVALVVSLGLIFVVNKGSDQAREYNLAEQFGRRSLEFYLANPSAIPPGLQSFPIPYHTGQTDNAGNDSLNLTVNVTILPPNPPTAPYADVLVNVTWDTGMPRQILLEGYVAQ